MRNSHLVGLYTLAGALSFWFSDILLNARKFDSLILSTLLPTFGFVFSYMIIRRLTRSVNGPSRAFFMILGVWLFGSLAMMIGATFAGGGFATGVADTVGVIALGLLPPYTLIMATYDGSVLALLFTSCLALGVHLQVEGDHWILPATVRKVLRRWYERRTA